MKVVLEEFQRDHGLRHEAVVEHHLNILYYVSLSLSHFSLSLSIHIYIYIKYTCVCHTIHICV